MKNPPSCRRAAHLLARACLAVAVPACGLQAARAVDMPKRKPGQWEMTVAMQGQKPMKMLQCVDPATDDLSQSMGGEGDRCSKPDITRSGDTWLVTTRCEQGGRKIVSKGRMTMKGDAAFTGSSTMTFEPPMPGRSAVESTVQARWTGPCPAGMKPGDTRIEGLGSLNPGDVPPPAPGGAMSREDALKRREQAMKMLEEMKRSGRLPAN